MATPSTLRAIVIPADSDQPVIETTLSRDHQLARTLEMESRFHPHTLMELVIGGGCDFIETVNSTLLNRLLVGPHLSPRHVLCMVVDEDGHDRGQPVNERACVFYRGTIWGTVILLGEDRSSYDGYDLEDLPACVTVDTVNEYINNHL